MVDEIPVAHTPPGGYGATMPAPILGDCDEPLAAGAPDLRGNWTVTQVTVNAEPAPAEHRIHSHVERIEQGGDRVVITAGGVIHDMRADGTAEHGVNDVAHDFATQIQVVATFENAVLVLRPVGMRGVEVRRWRDGDELVWDYAGAFTARMKRTERP